MNGDDLFFDEAKKAIKEIEPEEEDNKKPIIIIAGLFIAIILLISFIPYYAVKLNPSPDLDVVRSFELTSAEKVRLENITGGHQSISAAISALNIADYRTITVRLVTSACEVESDLCFAKAIYYYVRDQTTYVSDPISQYVQTPAETLLIKGGDCEDKSLELAVMLESIGIDADIGLTSNHAFVRAQLPSAPFWQLINSDYVYLDPSTNLDFGKISFKLEEIVGFLEI